MPRLSLLPRATPTTTNTNTNMTNIESHTNDNGTTYYSTTDENGQTIYSFADDFNDIWTQDDENAIESGSTPSKI
jgi:hypothetical protein